ncbi:MAG TPA: 2-dehydro-3-deoxygalactonokinase [Steroidobacteraceae bacterium]|nr:2-dehydro-3-deoxygalactonokinase [Steroidobacteraceae bacterium]
MPRAAFIAGDWGTSQLRLYLCDAANNVLEARVARGAAAARGEHEQVLDGEIAGWENSAGPLPVVLCGMIGSSIGWVQAPYLPAPADPQGLAAACVSLRGGRVLIVPGVSCSNCLAAPDVMRGEETQILGALKLDPRLRIGQHLVCLPGTHTKWVVVRGGAIVEFLTAPTGELFELLSKHSVMVRDGADERAMNDTAFEAGLERVRALPGVELLHRIFEVRSRRLLAQMPPEDAASYMSGLLIGSDVAGAARVFADEIRDKPVYLIAAPGLVRAYSTALRAFGLAPDVIDGGSASLAGLGEIFRLSQPGGAQRATG